MTVAGEVGKRIKKKSKSIGYCPKSVKHEKKRITVYRRGMSQNSYHNAAKAATKNVNLQNLRASEAPLVKRLCGLKCQCDLLDRVVQAPPSLLPGWW